MSKNDLNVKKILEMIKENRIDPKKGLQMIKELKEGAGSEELNGFGEASESDVFNESDEFGEEQTQAKVVDILCRILRMEESEISFEISFKEMGMDSISGVEIIRDINKEFGINLDAVVLYDYPTVPELTKCVAQGCVKAGKAAAKPEPRAQAKAPHAEAKPAQTSRNYKDVYTYMNQLVDKFSKQPVEGNGSKTESVPQAPTVRQMPTAAQTPAVRQMPTATQTAEPLTPKQDAPAKLNYISEKAAEAPESNEGIAVIGLSGRFPGANNVKKLWQNIRDGVCSIVDVPKDRFDIDECFDSKLKTPNKTYCKAAGFVDNVDRFDPLFFNISPMEAEMIDPQQRIFLQEAWKALEDAGYSDKLLSNARCGVFVGAAPSDYSQKLKLSDLHTTAEAFMGTSTSILAARISYILNLKGPSMSMDTACSSSLIAIHQACRSIWDNECDMALAGGIRLILTPELLVQSSQMEILSSTGVCRTFDQDADGTLVSEGVGVVVLKPLKKALKDRDYIYGVIRGTGANQDGKTNGITAPSMISQTNLEAEVYSRFGINPEHISYVEAHGTGTKLGDPIEIKALTEAFKKFTDKKQFCAIGSIKANIGHTTMAAGVTSLIKVLLAMKYKKIPPLINFGRINEHINLEDSPFFINTKLIDWATMDNVPRLAVISSFGFSGTNCHIAVEECPER